jgi:hypothetical protein
MKDTLVESLPMAAFTKWIKQAVDSLVDPEKDFRLTNLTQTIHQELFRKKRQFVLEEAISGLEIRPQELEIAKPLRTMREFAEQEIVILEGPFRGRRFRCHRQPYTGLWFDAVDSGRWSRYVATGPMQSGKTLVSDDGRLLLLSNRCRPGAPQ